MLSAQFDPKKVKTNEKLKENILSYNKHLWWWRETVSLKYSENI